MVRGQRHAVFLVKHVETPIGDQMLCAHVQDVEVARQYGVHQRRVASVVRQRLVHARLGVGLDGVGLGQVSTPGWG